MTGRIKGKFNIGLAKKAEISMLIILLNHLIDGIKTHIDILLFL